LLRIQQLSMQDNEYSFENSFGRLIGVTHTALVRHLAKLMKVHQLPITPDQLRVLVHLWQGEAKSQQELAVLSCRDRANITRIIDILEREGLVMRKDDEKDRRVFKIYLTQLGKDLETPTTTCAKAALEEALAGISAEEITICRNVLQKIIHNLETVPPFACGE